MYFPPLPHEATNKTVSPASLLRPHRNSLVPTSLSPRQPRQQTQDGHPRSCRPRPARIHSDQPDCISIIHGLHGGCVCQEEARRCLVAGVQDQFVSLALGTNGEFWSRTVGASRVGGQCGGVGVELLFELYEQQGVSG